MLHELTRRDVVDALTLSKVSYNGRLEEVDFLGRLYDLKSLPSFDSRFDDARGDIFQHRVNNYDWEDDWVFTDPRFDLLHGAEDGFLRFLALMVHPTVRSNQSEVVTILDLINPIIRREGWEIAQSGEIAGLPVYGPQRTGIPALPALSAAKGMARRADTAYVHQQIRRIEESMEKDPEQAIGTAKELVETVAKTILLDHGEAIPDEADFPKLVRAAMKQLRLVPDDIPEKAYAADIIKKLLMNLATVSNGLAELRNGYGTGHGKAARTRGLSARHARLAVGAATTLAVFMQETSEEMLTGK